MTVSALAEFNALFCALNRRLSVDIEDETTESFRDEMDYWWKKMTDAERQEANRSSVAIDDAMFG